MSEFFSSLLNERRALIAGVGRRGVGDLLSQLGEEVVRYFLLLQCGIEDIGRVGVPELSGPRDQRSIARHLVVLDSLCGCDEAGVKRWRTGVFLHHLFTFSHRAIDCRTLLPLWLLPDQPENLLQP